MESNYCLNSSRTIWSVIMICSIFPSMKLWSLDSTRSILSNLSIINATLILIYPSWFCRVIFQLLRLLTCFLIDTPKLPLRIAFLLVILIGVLMIYPWSRIRLLCINTNSWTRFATLWTTQVNSMWVAENSLTFLETWTRTSVPKLYKLIEPRLTVLRTRLLLFINLLPYSGVNLIPINILLLMLEVNIWFLLYRKCLVVALL